MNFNVFVVVISSIARLFIYIIFASSLLSFVFPPYHPVREALDRIVNPFLNPIRSFMPQNGMFDFSPLILIAAVLLLSRLLISVILSL